jgi:hypothetical protein
MALSWPDAQSVKNYLITRSYTIPQGNEFAAEYEGAVTRAITRVNRLTRRDFTLTQGMKTLYGTGRTNLVMPWCSNIETMVLRLTSDFGRETYSPYNLVNIEIEYEPYNFDSGDDVVPFRRIILKNGHLFPRKTPIDITGTWGYSAGPPPAVSRAALLFACAEVAPMSDEGKGGPVIAWQATDRVREEYSEPADSPQSWMAEAHKMLQEFIDPPFIQLRRPL